MSPHSLSSVAGVRSSWQGRQSSLEPSSEIGRSHSQPSAAVKQIAKGGVEIRCSFIKDSSMTLSQHPWAFPLFQHEEGTSMVTHQDWLRARPGTGAWRPEGDPPPRSPSTGASADAQLSPSPPVGTLSVSGPVPQGSLVLGRRCSPGRLGQGGRVAPAGAEAISLRQVCRHRHGGSARPINNPEGAEIRQRSRRRPCFPRPPGLLPFESRDAGRPQPGLDVGVPSNAGCSGE